MTQYIIRRLLMLVPVVLGVSIVAFFLLRTIPGDVAAIKCGPHADTDCAEQFRKENGLDRPLVIQYFNWLGDFVQGDFGKSYVKGNTEVRDELANRLPVTLEIMAMALIISLAIAIPVGVLAGARPNTPADLLARLMAVLGISLPGFWIATLLIIFPQKWFGYTPPIAIPVQAPWEDPWLNFQQFIFPAFTIGLASAAGIMRLTRSSVLEVLKQDYVRTAWAKGLTERTIITRHVLKNSLIPVVTIVGTQVGHMIAGTVIMENIFGLAGVGQLILDSITKRDYLAVQAVVVLVASVFVLANLAVDILYVWLDPRIRYN